MEASFLGSKLFFGIEATILETNLWRQILDSKKEASILEMTDIFN